MTMKGLPAFLLLCASMGAEAITLSLAPNAPIVHLGSPVSIDLNISGLGLPPYLGDFDVDVTYDPALFSLGSISFGDNLGDSMDISQTFVSTDTATAGSVRLFEVSQLDQEPCANFCNPPYLEDLQLSSTFRLATLNFTAITLGTGLFTLDINSLDDGAFPPNALTADVQNTQVSVVPEPGALSLLGLGLLAGIALGGNRIQAKSERSLTA